MAYKHLIDFMDKELNLDSGTERYVFIEVCYRSDKRGIIRMSQSELAEIMLLSPRTIAGIFSKMERKHLLNRIGHGRYQIISPDEDKETVDLSRQVRQWISSKDCDAFEDGYVNIFEHEIAELPDFIKKAIELGLLQKGETGSVFISPGKTKSFTQYNIHL